MLDFDFYDSEKVEVEEARILFEGVKRVRDDVRDIFCESEQKPAYVGFVEALTYKYANEYNELHVKKYGYLPKIKI